jgi:hypothetical protein
MDKDISPLESAKREEKNLRGKARRLYEKPHTVANERLEKIRSDLKRVEPKETKDPNNICMHQHLKYMERAYEEDPVKILHSEAEVYEKDADTIRQNIKGELNGN